MTIRRKMRLVCWLLSGLVVGVLAGSGCGKDKDQPKHFQVKGKVTAIDTSSGAVKIMWYNPKQKREEERTGTLAPESEIWINGKTARLEDVLIDDTATIAGRLEKKDGEPKLVAIRVDIRRATTEPAAGEAASTQPAEPK